MAADLRERVNVAEMLVEDLRAKVGCYALMKISRLCSLRRVFWCIMTFGSFLDLA